MTDLLGALPGAVAQGIIWGIMAIGVYITYKVLDIADLTVDGSICTGAAVCTMMMLSGQSPWLSVFCAVLAGIAAGSITGFLHVLLGKAPSRSVITVTPRHTCGYTHPDGAVVGESQDPRQGKSGDILKVKPRYPLADGH